VQNVAAAATLLRVQDELPDEVLRVLGVDAQSTLDGESDLALGNGLHELLD